MEFPKRKAGKVLIIMLSAIEGRGALLLENKLLTIPIKTALIPSQFLHPRQPF
jgi:hypothetical protein